MHRLTRYTLTYLNSSESQRFYSFIGDSRLRFSTVKYLAAPFSVTNPGHKSLSIASNSKTFSAVPGRFTPAGMDSDRLAASGFEDFVRVDGEIVNSTNSEGSDESVVEERGVDEVSSVNEEGEGQSQPYERKVLPEELSRNVMTLTCESSADGGICDVYVVGTAHVSAESCQEVEAVINFLKPQVVFLELCSGRVAVLTPHNLKVPTMGEMMDMWKKNQNPFGILYSWFLAKVANKLEVVPGAEFRVAYEEAMKYGGKVILGDRPVQITLRRTWAKMPLWHKTKFLFSLFFQALFLPNPEDLNKMLKEMDDVDMLTLVIQEMSKHFPTLWTTLVHERDLYMSSTLLRVAGEHNSVVAVVGKGHLPGIKKNWKQPIEVKELLTIPSQKPAISVTRILSMFGVAVAGVAIISGIYTSSKK
nr:PREDICTED: traB domain-containing protein-like [Nicotiana tabacum]